MKVGDIEVIAGGWVGSMGGHAIMYIVERTASSMCTFTVCNTGDGIEAHPSISDQFPGTPRVRTAVSIENVKIDRVTDPALLYMLLQLKAEPKDANHKKAFYAVILPFIVGGPIKEAIRDSSKNGPYRTPQRSGTCYYR